MKQILSYRLLTALALCNAGSALAQSCEHPSEWPTPFQINLPLQGTITVGADVPDGTEIYTARHNSGSGAFIRCTGGPGRVQRENGYIGVPGEPSGLPGIYKTSIPGVGIAVWYAGNRFPFDPGAYDVGTAPLRVTFNKQLDFSLYKIGPISAGVLQGSSLPRARQSTLGTGGINIWEAQIVGQLNIVTGTCRVGDVTVSMGRRAQRELNAPGAATPWTMFIVPLSGCPAFFGRQPAYFQDDSGTGEVGGRRVANRIGLRVDPSTPVLDAAQSIMALSNKDHPDTAKGLGIQVALPDNTPVGYGVFRDSGLTLTTTPNGTYAVRMRARYVQTQARVRPGIANGAMVVTLRYE